MVVKMRRIANNHPRIVNRCSTGDPVRKKEPKKDEEISTPAVHRPHHHQKRNQRPERGCRLQGRTSGQGINSVKREEKPL